ncbi:MobA/MobL family protein [Phenylobacterium sp. LjRoot225]|uniref:MobQ family relaxase n=1 Tax=Phenylobacterium sp. LjRoot225 TaxID=3342285 RepID=UPI003ECE8AF6
MAQYRLAVQTIQRGLGRSAVAAAAYRAGDHLIDERLAMEFDFSAKDGIEHAEIITPQGAPAAYSNREVLWNAVEAAERRKDAVPAQEILLSLPHELSFAQRRELVREWVKEHLVAHGMIADVAMHRPGKEGDQRNFHAHVLVTTREVGPEGLGKKNRDWHHASFVPRLRSSWAEVQNKHLREHLGPNAPQVSHLSLADQGLDRAPTVHLGPTATALERKQIASERGEHNRDVKARNTKAHEVQTALDETIDRVAAARPRVEVTVEKLIEGARSLRADMMSERDSWKAEKEGLKAPPVPTARQIERELTSGAVAARNRARARFLAIQERVKETRSKRLQLVQWIRNPARMIWAKHAELNAIAKARQELKRAEAVLTVRQAWARSEKGQAYIVARRQPALEKAVDVTREKRTLERKIKRMDKRIATATRTYNDLRVAHELGISSLRVPRSSPDATRFMRDVGQPTRAVLQQFPAQERAAAIDRINRGVGRSITQNLGISR